MKNKKNISLYVSIIFIISLIASGAKKFITVEDVSLYSFEVKGFKIALAAGVFLVYSLVTKRKALSIISILIAFLGYFYTGYSLFFSGLTSLNISYGLGFYLYFASFFFLGISSIVFLLTLLNKEKVDDKSIHVDDSLENISNIQGKYILANYIMGISKRPDLYEKISVIVSSPETNNLGIVIGSDPPVDLTIPYNDIVSICINGRVIMNNVKKEIKDDYTANVLLLLTLTNNLLVTQIVAKSGLMSDLSNYDKIKYDTLYEIEITYMENGVSNKLLFHSKINPNEFFKNFSEKIVYK